MRVVQVALLLTLMTVVASAQEISVRSNVAVRVAVVSQMPGRSLDYVATTPFSAKFKPGEYVVRFDLPDGTTSERAVTVRKRCTVRVELDYRPPSCPACPAPVVVPVVTPVPQPTPESEPKPEPVPTRFDQCCGCKRDDLKARLDLFAIRLHSDPTTRGRIVAANNDAIDYLVNQRRVDRVRLELRASNGNCVELWILP